MHRVIERATMSAISVVNLAAQRHLAPLHPDQSLHHRQRRIPLSPVVDWSIGLSVLSYGLPDESHRLPSHCW